MWTPTPPVYAPHYYTRTRNAHLDTGLRLLPDYLCSELPFPSCSTTPRSIPLWTLPHPHLPCLTILHGHADVRLFHFPACTTLACLQWWLRWFAVARCADTTLPFYIRRCHILFPTAHYYARRARLLHVERACRAAVAPYRTFSHLFCRYIAIPRFFFPVPCALVSRTLITPPSLPSPRFPTACFGSSDITFGYAFTPHYRTHTRGLSFAQLPPSTLPSGWLVYS